MKYCAKYQPSHTTTRSFCRRMASCSPSRTPASLSAAIATVRIHRLAPARCCSNPALTVW